jgi:flagellar biogenesis protein FliO
MDDTPATTVMLKQLETPASGLLRRAWSWVNKKYVPAKQLRVAETVSLGEKRFVAVVQVEGRKFLIGGGSSGVALLTQLGETAVPDSGTPAGVNLTGSLG